MKGLATYQLIKLSGILYISVCFLCSGMYFLISNISKNYQKTQGNIITNKNNTQTLTYTVNNILYTQNIPFTLQTVDTKTNITTPPHAQFIDGQCTVYYAQNNPNDYNVNTNPLFMSQILTGVLCCFSCFSCLSFIFFYKNREVAGVVGGIDVANSFIRNIKN